MRHHSEIGSALILVLLVSLVLSAFGIVAMRDIAVGTQQSAGFRVRTQASQVSNAAVGAFSMRTGNKAEHYLSLVTETSYGTETTSSTDGAFGVEGIGGGFAGLAEEREAYATHGGFVVFDHETINTSSAGNEFFPGQTLGGAVYKNESGLLTTAGFNSFEAREQTSWQVILRNVSSGFPAPGYSERYCFRRATIGSASQVGVISPTWSEPTNVGRGIHAREVFLGPIPCGYN